MPELIRFTVLMAAGLAAAATIGKYVPHINWAAQQFGVSLAAIGVLVSGVMIPGAVFGTVIGRWVDRFGPKRAALVGLVLHAAASAASGLSQGFWQIMALRMVEGFGYCLLIVGATVLVVVHNTAKRQGMALAGWSAFAPIGFALGQWASSYMDGPGRLAMIGQSHGLILIAIAVLMLFSIPRDGAMAPAAGQGGLLAALRHPPAFRAGMAFGIATGVLLAAVALAPQVLAPVYQMNVSEIARLTALAALPGVIGRFGSGALLGLGLVPRFIFALAGLLGTAAMVICFHLPMPLGVALILFAIFQITLGVLPGVLSVMIPHVARKPEEIGMISGLISQMVNLGNLFGPPLALGLFAAAGAWPATAALVIAILIAVALVFGLAVFKIGTR
jgi:MFS family permease